MAGTGTNVERNRIDGRFATRPAARPPLHTSALIYTALQIAFLSFLFSYYNVNPGNVIRPVVNWTIENLQSTPVVQKLMDSSQELWTNLNWFAMNNENVKVKKKSTTKSASSTKENIDILSLLTETDRNLKVFTSEQLSFFDGTRSSKDIHLAILGRVYNVQKGSKHYGPGGGYHFFAGRDATRAFVSGDFSDEGLVEDVTGLSNQDFLGIYDWIAFYEKDYELVGYLQGTYYDSNGKPTGRLKEVVNLIVEAQHWREASAEEAKVFPPCNSEWRKDTGGRVWCSKKSGGIEREWSGVPRKLFDHASKDFRCVCVKNFGSPLSKFPGSDKSNQQGDLDNPNLREYSGCNPTSITCKNDAA